MSGAPRCGARAACLAAAIAAVATPDLLQAAGLPTGDVEDIEEIVVTDKATLVGEPASATQGVVLSEQLAQRPVARPAELLEFAPGLIATQHSGEGKANQYFLRGFNLDHGTDFYVEAEGLPVNMRTHGHGQGYADLNFVITPLVDQLEYRKGPYYATVGDFSAAGSADFRYARRLDESRGEVTVGEDEFYDVLLAASPRLGDADLLMGLQYTSNAGPFDVDQNLRKTNAVMKYSEGDRLDGFSITGMAYDGEWDSADQIPRRAVDTGLIGALGFIDDTVGGESHRYSLSANLRRPRGEGHWDLAAYAIDYELDLFSNFTYLLEDPVNGDQFEQVDDRQLYGLSGHYHLPLDWTDLDASVQFGLQVRHDDIDEVGLYRTRAKQRIDTVRRDSVRETSVGLYGQFDVRWNDTFRSILGLRVDRFDVEVDAHIPQNSGTGDDATVSPKLSLVFGPWAETEYFFNIGKGFHSNDARGVTISVDPNDGVTPVAAVDTLVDAWGVDLGMRTALVSDLQLAVAAWGLRIDSELVFVGDGGATEANGESERYGLELSAFWTPAPTLIVDADYAWSHARFTGTPDDRIPGAVEHVASIGLTWSGSGAWSGGLRARYLGEAPLTEDASASSDPTTVVNGQLSYAFDERLELTLGAYNILDSDDADITYFYESRLPGEAAGVEDIHFKPVQPRQLRLTLESRF